MGKYKEPLDKKGWSALYNTSILNNVVKDINEGNVQVWAKELVNIMGGNSTKCLEIGCGTGISSLWLAKNGCEVTAVDYTKESVELVTEAAKELELCVNAVCCDARTELPFREKQFDYLFQCGLLEHFDSEMQVRLLKGWSRYANRIVSMVPNSSSLPYRVGKEIMEREGRWPYGLEIPKHTLISEYFKAGLVIEKEYTIGSEWALKFLPKDHYLVSSYQRLIEEGYCLDDYMQGYLLVTIGLS